MLGRSENWKHTQIISYFVCVLIGVTLVSIQTSERYQSRNSCLWHARHLMKFCVTGLVSCLSCMIVLELNGVLASVFTFVNILPLEFQSIAVK